MFQKDGLVPTASYFYLAHSSFAWLSPDCGKALTVLCMCRSNDVLVEQLSQPPPESQPLHFDRPYAASSWQQFTVLSHRWFTSYW